MLRIIGGSARSRKLEAPPGTDTRPTADRAREAVFNILAPRIEGARVLDLFAGSGAIGFEALSRGAACAVLVDASAAAERAMRANREALGMAGAEILRMDACDAVRMLARQGRRFEIVWLDPPYRAGLAEAAVRAAGEGALARGGVIALEHAASMDAPRVEGLEVYDARRYGVAKVSFYRAMKLPEEVEHEGLCRAGHV